VTLEDIPTEDLEPVIMKLRSAGVEIERDGAGSVVSRHGPLRAVDATTAPHPGFPTDMQAQLMALLTIAQGTSVLT
jgi:UDP-N-acetylglucosamine 1-carboxyvinyltransferase